MIGGSLDAFIGAVHRKAAALDGEIELVCGAFSSDPAKSFKTGEALFLPRHRVYASYQQMIETEHQLPADERMDFVSIVTPNHVHAEPAMLALNHGFHVMIDKPLAFSLTEARAIQHTVEKTNNLLALTHTYTAYPMVKEAKAMIKQGRLGRIRKIYVEYAQGWLSQLLEKQGQKQASWRTDPKRSGIAGAMGDIGTHAANLAEYVSGLQITAVSAAVNTVVKGRQLDDDGAALLQFEKEASGVLIATQVAAGEENNLTLRVYGELGGLEWRHEDPNTLLVKWPDKPTELVHTGMPNVSELAKTNTRTPSGHPEGYLEAFANIYLAFAQAIRTHKPTRKVNYSRYDFPNVYDGVHGMAFVETVIKSANSNQKWIKIKH